MPQALSCSSDIIVSVQDMEDSSNPAPLHLLIKLAIHHISDLGIHLKLGYIQTPKMKPVVSALNAWSCIVVSVFAIVILSTIGAMFKVSGLRFR